MKSVLFAFSLLACWQLAAQPPVSLPVGAVLPTRQVPVHDPVVLKEGGTYYLFCTGMGIAVWSSNDLRYWRKEKPVFASAPQWAVDTIPGFKGHIWAPDISYHNGLYYLYYSVSAFGKNTSAIGVATNQTLDPASPDFAWVDHGRVIQSYPGKTNWNAIDPNLVMDKKGNPFLFFGSFWDGLKMVRLKRDLATPAVPLATIPTVASRKRQSSADNPPAIDNNPVDAGGNAIEAPFIYRKGAYYYFFASIDYCCKGEQSTYKVIVARSKKIGGPYLDKSGQAMSRGGGTPLLQGDKEWYGVGHNGVFAADGKDYIVYHGYDAADGGKSKLRISELGWDEQGWPVINNFGDTTNSQVN